MVSKTGIDFSVLLNSIAKTSSRIPLDLAAGGGRSTAKFTGNVKDTLKLCRQGSGDGIVDAIVIIMTT